MRRGAWRCNTGLGKEGALPLVLIVQATAEEVHRAYKKPRHKPMLRWSDALLQGPAVGEAPAASRLSEPNTTARAPAPPTAATRRREEGVVGRSVRAGSTHGAVRGPSNGQGRGLRQRKDYTSWCSFGT